MSQTERIANEVLIKIEMQPEVGKPVVDQKRIKPRKFNGNSKQTHQVKFRTILGSEIILAVTLSYSIADYFFESIRFFEVHRIPAKERLGNISDSYRKFSQPITIEKFVEKKMHSSNNGDKVFLFKSESIFITISIEDQKNKKLRRPYRKAADLPVRKLPPGHEKNRRDKRVSMQIDHSIVRLISKASKQSGLNKSALMGAVAEERLLTPDFQAATAPSELGIPQAVQFRLDYKLIERINAAVAETDVSRTKWLTEAFLHFHASMDHDSKYNDTLNL